MILIHGLGATSDYWSGAYDSLGSGARVVVPDLLGFGRSLDESRDSFALPDHLEALTSAVAAGAPGASSLTVVAHSMGTALGLAFAAHDSRVGRVICVGAPVYRSEEDARAAFAQGGPMARLFLLDTRWAERACRVNCANRTLAGVVAAVAEPTLPVPIARRASLHTWVAYLGAVRSLVLRFDWEAALAALSAPTGPSGAGAETTLLWGDRDRIGDRSPVAELVSRHPDVQVMTVAGADHRLPITHPRVLIDMVEAPPNPARPVVL